MEHELILDGRPDRTDVINHEDIINLIILLETCNDVEEFLFMEEYYE